MSGDGQIPLYLSSAKAEAEIRRKVFEEEAWRNIFELPLKPENLQYLGRSAEECPAD